MRREHRGPVGLDVFVEPQAGRGLRQHRGERGLAHVERVAPQVVAVERDQVERVREDIGVVPPVTDAVEARHAVVAAAHRLAVDDRGASAQPRHRLDDQQEAVREVVPRAAVEPHAVAVLAHDDAEAVVFDLV
jgi:hypothetical protein